MSTTKLIVGLGNPGEQYKNQRHNVGFMLLDRLAEYFSVNFDNNKKKSLYSRFKYEGNDIILLKPQTFMNLSGESVIYVSKFYNVSIDNIIVVYDDMDIPFGSIKIKKSGSAAGHNGIKNIIAQLQTDSFIRLRVGISRPSAGKPINEYVLSSFSKSERTIIENDIYSDVLDAIKTLIFEGLDTAQQRFNATKKK